MDLKTLLPVICLWIAIIPWGSGGKDPLSLVVSSFALVLAGFFIWREPSRRTNASFLLSGVMAAFVAWSVLSLVWTANRYQTEIWSMYLILGLLVFSLSASLNQAQKRLLVEGYIWIAAAVGLIGLAFYFTGDYGRLTSIFYWANPAAGYLLPAFLLAMTKFADRPKWHWGVLSTFIGTTFFLTDSRGGVLVLSVVMALALLVSRFVRQNWKHFLLILVAAFLLSIGFTYIKGHNAPAPGSRFAEAALGESQSLSDRWQYLGSALKIWEKHPALGTGAGTYGTVHPQYQHGVTDATNNPHSLYLQVAAEMGLIGFLLLLWIWVLLLVGVIRGSDGVESGVVGLSVIALLLHFGLEIDSSYPTLISLLFMLSGVVYRPLLHRRLHWPGVAIMPMLAVMLAGLSISTYTSRVQADKAEAASDNHDYATAADYYARAHSGWVYNPDYWTAEGIDFYVLEGIAGTKTYGALAEDRASQAIARDPEDAQHYFLRARVERLGGNLDAAVKDYEYTLKLDPYNHPEYYLDLAQTKLQQKDKDAAQSVAQRGLALYRDDVISKRNADPTIKPAIAGLLVVTAYDQIAHGQLQEAKRTLGRALRLDPSNMDAQTLLQQGQNIIIPAQ